MKCYVYKSSRRADTYVYLGQVDGFSVLPDALRQQLGNLSLALEVELSPERRLALAEATAVLASIADKGYFLQLPPDAGHPETTA